MQNALILPAWHQKVNSNWYPWLKNELLKRGYYTEIVDLPGLHDDILRLDTQMDFLEENFAINEDTVIVGHSVGGVLALRVAEQNELNKLFLVAAWDYNDLTRGHESYWQEPINHQRIKNNVNEVYYLGSDNDKYFTAYATEQMAKRLSGKFILVPHAGHFLESDGVVELSQVLESV